MAFVYWIHFKEHTDVTTEGYVGITSTTVKKRIHQHRTAGKSSTCKRGISSIFKQYDSELIVTVLCECSVEYAGYLEFTLRPVENTAWNIAIGGNTVKMTAEGRLNVSNKLKGVPKPQHVLDAMNKARLLKPVSDESRRKWSIASKGHIKSPETRLKISQNRKGISPPRSQLSIDNSIATFLKKHPLDLPNQNKTVWLDCDFYYSEFLLGNSKYIASLKTGASKGSLGAMWKRFNLGFNPLTDPRWVSWKLSEGTSTSVTGNDTSNNNLENTA
jgi:hypothetical protein